VLETALQAFEANAGPGATARALFGPQCTDVRAVRERFCEPFLDAVERFMQLILYGDLVGKSAIDLFQMGVPPSRSFIKNEPHSKAKLAEGRARVINGVDLVVNVCAYVLYSTRLEAENAQYLSLPGSSGWGLGLDADVAAFHRAVWRKFQRQGVAMTTDVSAFDASIRGWMHYAMLRVMHYTCVNVTPFGKRAYANMQWVCSHMPVVDSAGYVWVYPEYIGYSGRLLTLSDNSWMRAILSAVVRLHFGEEVPRPYPIKTMGDDAIEMVLRDAVSRYAQFGFKLTDCVEVRSGQAFEFCSHLVGEVAVPLNPLKPLFGALVRPYKAEVWDGVAYALRHWPLLGRVEDELTRQGWLPGKA
jgi:hypothetical protein